ncbi:MAG TPA: hypothetical protein VJB10_04305 [Candidatus Peribacteraceae bacterium]|nr:hypothetical protein [Candidatus Peribacteraceae bacterium]
MRETLLLLSGFVLLSSSTNLDVLLHQSVPYSPQSASTEQVWIASLKSTTTKIKAQTSSPAKDERVHSSMTREMKRQYEIAAYRRTKAQARTTPTATPSPRVATLHPIFDKQDIEPEHRIIADQAFRIMPDRCQAFLKNFYVRYDNPQHRGLGGKSTIILTGSVPDEEFRALFLHEFGHLTDLGCFQGTAVSGLTPYMDKDEQIWKDDPSVGFYQISWMNSQAHNRETTEEDFVSGYASWDMFEDFAESFVYYVLHREVFARRAAENDALAAKYQWFQEHLPDLPKVAKSNTRWDGTIPWDITKLSYEWKPPTELVARR